MPAIAEGVGGAFKRVKVAVSPRPNTAEKLEAALAELKRIVEGQQAAKQEAGRALQAVTAGQAEAQQAVKTAYAAIEAGDADALREYVIAQLVLKESRELSMGLQRQALASGEKVPPSARAVLQNVCQLRLAAARAAHATVLTHEQQRLDQTHGAGEYSAEDSQVVKRLQSKVDTLETRLARITSNEDLTQVWLGVAQPLLDNE